MYCFSGSDPSSEISPFPPWVPDNFSKRNFLIWDPERFTIHSFKLIYDAVLCRMPDSSMTFLKVFSNTEHCNITCSLIFNFIFGWFYYIILNECILEFENFNFPIMHSVVGAIYLLSNDGSEGSFLCEKNIWRKNIPSSRDSSYFRPEMHLLCDNFFSLLN